MMADRVQATSPLNATFQSAADTRLVASKIWAHSRSGGMQASAGWLNAAAASVAVGAQRHVRVAAATGFSSLRAVGGDTLVQSTGDMAVSAALGSVRAISAGSVSASSAQQIFQGTESGLIESPVTVSLAGSGTVITSNSLSHFTAQRFSAIAHDNSRVAASDAALVRAYQIAKLQSSTDGVAIVSQGSVAPLKLAAATSSRLSAMQGTVTVVSQQRVRTASQRSHLLGGTAVEMKSYTGLRVVALRSALDAGDVTLSGRERTSLVAPGGAVSLRAWRDGDGVWLTGRDGATLGTRDGHVSIVSNENSEFTAFASAIRSVSGISVASDSDYIKIAPTEHVAYTRVSGDAVRLTSQQGGFALVSDQDIACISDSTRVVGHEHVSMDAWASRLQAFSYFR